ncbi:unnamed protein product, partial [Symbiodinium pilosum]
MRSGLAALAGVATSVSQVSVEIRRDARNATQTLRGGPDNTSLGNTSLGNATRPMHVAFNISVFGNASADPRQRALATKVLMEEADSRQIARAMNTALAARGLQVLVQAADLT